MSKSDTWSQKKLIKWFDEKGDYCPDCLDFLDFQRDSGCSKDDEFANYSAHCSCDIDLMWSHRIENKIDKLVEVTKVC